MRDKTFKKKDFIVFRTDKPLLLEMERVMEQHNLSKSEMMRLCLVDFIDDEHIETEAYMEKIKNRVDSWYKAKRKELRNNGEKGQK